MIIMITVIIAVLVLLPIAIYHSARAEKQFTFVKTGEIKFVVRGKSFARLIMDVPGYIYDASNDLIRPVTPDDLQPPLGLIEHLTGARYVSLIYPYHRVWTWLFEWDKQTREADTKDDVADSSPKQSKAKVGPVDAYNIIHRKEHVNSLYHEFTYPLLAQNLELNDTSKVDIRMRLTLRMRKPRFLVFTLNGTWYPAAMNAITAFAADFVKQRNTNQMFDASQTNGEVFKAWFTERNLILQDSIEIVEAILEGFEPSGEGKVQEAQEAQRVAEIRKVTLQLEGEAEAAKKIAIAHGEATAILQRGQAEADILELKRQKLGDPLMSKKFEADMVENFGGSALSIGGGGHQALVGTPTTSNTNGGAS